MVMHSKNILHRDLKPDNIFLGENNVIKLGDFGISKCLSLEDSRTNTFCGTPYYMAPEVVKFERYNHKSDIWALGCSIYELTMLQKPFDAEDTDGLYKAITEKEYEPLPEHLDPQIKMLIYYMLDKDKNRRPSVWQICNIGYIKERVTKFVREYNCEYIIDGIKSTIETVGRLSFPMTR